MDNYLTFCIRDGIPHVVEMNQYETRGDSCFQIFERLLAMAPELCRFEKGVIFFGDSPPCHDLDMEYILQFCTTKPIRQSRSFLPFPCPHSLRWPQVGIENSEDLLTSLLQDSRIYSDNRVFWIGANTHPIRARLIDISFTHRKVLEAKMIKWQPTANGKIVCHPRFVSLQDHANYKYLIDCPGNGYSGRLKWLLATGRPTFIVERDIVEHWHDAMIPWVHYVPVAGDLSDIFTAYEKLEKQPSLYRHISENAKIFARDNIGLPQQLLFAVNHLEHVWKIL